MKTTKRSRPTRAQKTKRPTSKIGGSHAARTKRRHDAAIARAVALLQKETDRLNELTNLTEAQLKREGWKYQDILHPDFIEFLESEVTHNG